MAIDIQHDSEYLLPTHFLTTDDIISEVINLKQPEPKTWEIPIRFESYGSSSSSSSSSSALNSPVESELNSTDTESTTEEEEENYIAEMTRQMAHYMLQDDDDDDDEKHKIPTPASEDTEADNSLNLFGSSQLELSLWSPLSSNHGSPKGHFQELSPQKAINGKGDIWGLVTNIGENFETIKGNDDVGVHSHLNQIQLEQKQSRKPKMTKCGEKQAKPNQKFEPRRGRSCGGFVNGRKTNQPQVGPFHLSPPTWPPHMLQNGGSGMRALFLGGSNSRNGSCGGTGVFLPSSTVSPSESRKKTGCSRVLIPEKVIQVLQPHFDRMGALQSRSTAGDLPLQHGASMLSTNCNNNGQYSQQKPRTLKE